MNISECSMSTFIVLYYLPGNKVKKKKKDSLLMNAVG